MKTRMTRHLVALALGLLSTSSPLLSGSDAQAAGMQVKLPASVQSGPLFQSGGTLSPLLQDSPAQIQRNDFNRAMRQVPAQYRRDTNLWVQQRLGVWQGSGGCTFCGGISRDAMYFNLLHRYSIDVRSLKVDLDTLGYYEDDGSFVWTDEFWDAVRDYQSARGLDVDGVPGPITQGVISSDLASTDAAEGTVVDTL